jgi:hypothetical protein
MEVSAHRLRFSLDPLVAEARRRARRRRLLVLAALLVVVTTGTALTLRGSGGSGSSPTSAGHALETATLERTTFAYPPSWKRVDWSCWIGPFEGLLLTTAQPTPTCGSALPPRETLGRDGVAVWLGTAPADPKSTSSKLIRDPSRTAGLWPSETRATCSRGPRRRFGARLQDGNSDVLLGAVVCGPDYGRGERALQRLVSTASLAK